MDVSRIDSLDRESSYVRSVIMNEVFVGAHQFGWVDMFIEYAQTVAITDQTPNNSQLSCSRADRGACFTLNPRAPTRFMRIGLLAFAIPGGKEPYPIGSLLTTSGFEA